MKRLLVMLIAITAALLVIGSVMPDAVFADAKSDICSGAVIAGGECTASGSRINGLIRTLVNLFSIIIGIAAVLFIMFGAFRYITSAGDSNKVNSAKNTIIFALVGVAIAAVAQVIVRFVLNQTT